MTIGIFLEHYDPFISGAITSVKGLAHKLESLGHNVYIITPAVKGHVDQNSNIIRIPSVTTKQSDNTTIGLPSPATIKRLMEIKFDVIHSQDVLSTGAAGIIIARKQSIPYIQTYHTMWHRFTEQYKLSAGFKAASIFGLATTYPVVLGLRATGSLIKHYSAQERRNYSNLWWSHMVNVGNHASAVTVPSLHLKKSLIKAGLVTDLYHVPNGVTKSHYPSKILPPKKPNTLRIISVGRFSSEKRLDLLIKSMVGLDVDAEMIMVGDGPGFEDMEKLAFQNGLGQRIRFMGHLNNAAVRQLMKESDVFCLASYDFDNQPMVILEAIDAGLPIVYCDPNLREGLSKNNSVLTENSVNGITGALALFGDDKRRRQMSQASLRLSHQFSAEGAANRLLNIYSSVLKGPSYVA
jgi:1,2-diacylglycerol 3-alpha-glucosyltransferase